MKTVFNQSKHCYVCSKMQEITKAWDKLMKKNYIIKQYQIMLGYIILSLMKVTIT